MPGVVSRNMNGYGADYGRGHLHNGGPYMDQREDPYSRNSPYGGRIVPDDPYALDDPYRRGGEDIYRLPHRHGPSDRFNDILPGDQNSLADFTQQSNEPVFELDHLATYTAGTRSGVINVEDGLHRLRKMENTTGIWTMRCILIVERRHVVVLDKSTGEELERFPIECCISPTAVFKNDRREVYNNLILFTVVDDPRRKNSQGDLHIFQSIRVPSQDIVDEIIAAKEGRTRISGHGGRIPPPPVQPAPDPPRKTYDPYSFSGMRGAIDQQYIGTGLGRTQRPAVIDLGQNEVLERDVQWLNHCFDDIERFVARLQQAAEAYRELERRKRERGHRGKNRQSGDGMLSHRAKPPPAADFIDIFQKFKFSFNLLSKLKAHIHDPNAPELIHFLFTPLSLIYEASRDPFHGHRDLADNAISPVISHEAKQLLLNCLTSKEIELWQALGPRWTTSRDEWRGPLPQYSAAFYDGTRIIPSLGDEVSQVPIEHHHNQIHVLSRLTEPEPRRIIEPEPRRITEPEPRRIIEPEPRRITEPEHRPTERIYSHHQEIDHRDRFPIYPEEIQQPLIPSPRPPSPRHAISNQSESGFQDINEQHTERLPAHRPEPVRPFNGGLLQSREDENAAYLDEIRRNGLGSAYEALHDRVGKNAKEITVKKGDILQVIDNSRKWWKVRNYKGETGYAPYTILTEIKNEEFLQDTSKERHSGHYNSYLPQDQPPAPPMPPPAPDVARGRQPKRGEFRYF